MPVCGEHEHNDFRIVDFIYQPMFFGDPSAPLSAAVTFQWLGFSRTGTWMIHQFFKKLAELYESLWLFSFKTLHIQLRLVCVVEFIHSI